MNAGSVNKLYVTGVCVAVGILFFLCVVVDAETKTDAGVGEVFRMSKPCVDGDFVDLFLFAEVGLLTVVSAFVPSGLFVVIEFNEDDVPLNTFAGFRVDDNELSTEYCGGRDPVDCFVGCDELANLCETSVLYFVGVVDENAPLCFVGVVEIVCGRLRVST